MQARRWQKLAVTSYQETFSVIPMKGKIDKIKINNLADGRKYATLSINGETYNLWNAQYLDRLKEGDIISYNFTQKGRYKNIGNILKVESGQKTDIPKQSGLNMSIIPPAYRKDIQIARLSCLKSAIYATQDLIDVDLDKKTDTIIAVARKFEKYITDFGEIVNPDEKKK